MSPITIALVAIVALLAGMEGIPYAKPWNTILVRRSLGTVVYLVLALAIAGIVVLLGRIFF